MKYLSLIVFFVSGMSLQAVTLANVRDRIDAFRTNIWPHVVAKQQNYYNNRGTYWQGLITHTSIPNHVTSKYQDLIPDRINIHPTDQYEDWSNAFPDWGTTALPCAVRIDVYSGPAGDGWTMTVWGAYNGTIYTRCVNVGPEGWRAYGWTVYNPEE